MQGDRGQCHELPGRSGGHLRPAVRDREQDRAGLVVDIDGNQPVRSGLDRSEQALGFERVDEHDLDLGQGLLGRDDVGDPPA